MTGISEDDITISREKLKRVRERTLQAEKEKLHMKTAHRINVEIKNIIEEEIQ